MTRATELADRLEQAWTGRQPIAPLSEHDGLADVADAYAVQRAWMERRVADGDAVVGRKIGLTSTAVQQQLGVDEPDYGTLLRSRWFAATGGRASAPAELFLQGRVEGELAFLIGEPPAGAEIGVDDVLAATEALAPAFEIVDSRIADWRITLPDTVADNASFGGFVLGAWDRSLLDGDLREVAMELTRDGTDTAVQGVGAACLGHPAHAVAWLLTRLGQLGVAVQPGDIVLSGALAPMLPIAAGERYTLRVGGRPPLELAFE